MHQSPNLCSAAMTLESKLKETLNKSQKQEMSICERSEAIQQTIEMPGFSGLLRLRLADANLFYCGLFRPSLTKYKYELLFIGILS